MFAIVAETQQTRRVVIPAGSTGLDFTLQVPLSNVSKSFLAFGTEGSQNNIASGEQLVLGYIKDESTIRFEVNNAPTDPIPIRYHITEWSAESDVTIHHLGPFRLNSASSNIRLPHAVDVAKVLPFAHSNAQSQGLHNHMWDMNFTSSVTLNVITGTTNSLRSTAFQVVEFFDTTSVETGRATLTGTSLTNDIPVNEVDPDNTWVVVTYENDTAGQSAGETAANAYLLDSATLRFSRSTVAPAGGTLQGTYYLATLANGSIRTAEVNLLSGSTTTTVTIPQITRQIMLPLTGIGMEQHMGSVNTLEGAGADGYQDWAATVEFPTATSVKVQRETSASGRSFFFQFVHLGVGQAEFATFSPFQDEIIRDPSREFDLFETLCEITSQATKRLGDRFDISQSDASFWANQAYLEVANMAPHDALETIRFSSFTTGAPVRQRLPEDFNEPMTLSLVSWGADGPGTRREVGSRSTIQRIGPRDFADLSATSGEPQKYMLYDTFVEVWPSPNSNYSLELRYKEYPSVLTGCGSKLRLSPPWRSAVLYRTEQRLAELIGDDTHAVRARNEFASYVQTLDSDLAKRQKEKLRQGVSVSGYHRPRRKRPGRGHFSDPNFDKI